MSRQIEEEFDELLLYVAGLKKTFARRQDDHLFIIQQQNERLEDQSRLIDELAWQIRDLRASVRAVGDKLKVVEQRQIDGREYSKSPTLSRQRERDTSDYANVKVKSGNSSDSGNGSVGGGGDRLRRNLSITKPRITIMNEEVGEGVEILQVEEYPEYEDADTLMLKRSSARGSYDSEGIYEPIQFIERRDYTAPVQVLQNSPTTSSSSLSARHRQTKQEQQQQQTPPTPPERNNGGRGKRIDQQFHFPPPPSTPMSPVLDGDELPAIQSLQLRATKDYSPIVTRRVRTPSFNMAIMTGIAEETISPIPEEEDEEVKGEGFLRTTRRGSDREANSIKRRAYILPATSRS